MIICAEYWRDLAGLIMIVSEGNKHPHKRNCCITNLCSGQNEFQLVLVAENWIFWQVFQPAGSKAWIVDVARLGHAIRFMDVYGLCR